MLMHSSWPDEDTLPIWQVNDAEDLGDLVSDLGELEHPKTELEVLTEKISKLGFKTVDDFANYYGFTTLQEVKRHLNL